MERERNKEKEAEWGEQDTDAIKIQKERVRERERQSEGKRKRERERVTYRELILDGLLGRLGEFRFGVCEDVICIGHIEVFNRFIPTRVDVISSNHLHHAVIATEELLAHLRGEKEGTR